MKKGNEDISTKIMPKNKIFQIFFVTIVLFTFVYIIWANFKLPFKIEFNVFVLNGQQTSTISSVNKRTTVEFRLVKINDEPLKNYFKTHEKILNEKNASLRKIFITNPGDGGYGNRMYAFISSALIAILLDCQLVVNWRSKETLYVDPPIDLFDKVQINDGFSSNANQTYAFPHPNYPFRSVKDIKHLIENPYKVPENYMRYSFSSGRPLFTEISANIIYYDKFRLYKLAREETLDKAFVALKENKNYTNEELQGRVLDVAFEIGGNILNR